MRAGRQQNSLAISHDLAAYFSLEKKTQKSQNLMMSVFCSNTLATFLLQNAGIYAFLEAQISTFFLSSNLCFWPPQFAHVAQVFFSCSYSKAFAIYLKPYWKPCLMWVQYCVNLGHFIITEFCWCCGISDRLHVSSWKGQRLQGGALWFYSTACTKALLEMYPHIYLSFV